MRFLFFTFIFPWSSPRQIPSGKEVTQKSNSSKTWKASKIQFNWKLEKHQKSNSIENLKSIQNSNSISSTDKMTLYCHIISKFKRFETQRICFIQLHIAMTLGLKLKNHRHPEVEVRCNERVNNHLHGLDIICLSI